ncbi:DUF2069 domain-containing protein [Shewanella sp. GXUN23E]|uniref:DUF2069 domain-containing protein n=1 Tax=Shewanella sp. GXUN23E TaxID=3422498 RepID=UPI003D7C542D
MNTLTLLRLCRLGYIALLLLLTGWFAGQGLSGEYSLLFSLLWIVPLLLPLKGILKGEPYTFAWGGFILCLYLLHSLTLLYVEPDARLFAVTESVLLLALLTGFSFYARLRGKELGLGLKARK